MDKVYGFRLPDDLIKELEVILILEEKSNKSELVREMLWEAVSKRGGNNPSDEKLLRQEIKSLKGRIYQMETRIREIKGDLLALKHSKKD